ncbi:MAG: response regulator [Chitinispirillales bacterium]|jgi:signal transduction histidine kinase/CheY-like chemotaxis protein|nr:response regulator [Chitinispirillales bacterium]
MKKTKTPPTTAGAAPVTRPDAASRLRGYLKFDRYVTFSIALFILILAVGSATFLFSMRHIIRANKGSELAKNLELKRVKLESAVGQEIAITRKMAVSPIIQRHFQYPGDAAIGEIAKGEIDAYRATLSGSVFWVSDADKMFYFDDRAPYQLNIDAPENYWYLMTMNDTEAYNFNINYNPDLSVTNLWINVPVFNERREPVGILGSGFDLTAFIGTIYAVYRSRDEKMLFYFFNAAGEITGAEDISLAVEKRNLRDRFGETGTEILAIARNLEAGEVHTVATYLGQAAVVSFPVLEWYAVAILPDSLNDFKTPLTVFFFLGILTVAFILVISNIFIARLLTPLRETMVSLEAASRTKSNFLAKMSHEIRTPMNAIMGIVQIQRRKENLSDDTKNALDKIYSSSTLLLGIINDILDMSKIETGKLELSPVIYDVPSLIDDSVQFNIMRIGAKLIDFKLEVDENLPARLFGDELRLKQVLNNILSNAFKYTSRGRVSLSVSHKADGESADDIALIFKITDTGQGISEEEMKLLFSEYQRFNAGANRYVEGTGLGLNISRHLVDLMGGEIAVQSVFGEGSTFTIIVKQKMISEAGVIGTELSRRLNSFTYTNLRQDAGRLIAHGQFPDARVLVVDDVEVNLIVAEGLLSPYHIRVDKAESGVEAVEKIVSGQAYDIIFMDHMMPRMDGMEAMKEMRASGYGGVIIALTANAIVGNEKLFVESGFDDFMSKPIDVLKLDTILNKFLGGKNPPSAKQDVTDAPAVPADKNNVTAPETPRPTIVKMNERIFNVLKRDVAKAIITMRETIAGDNIKLFTTTVHGLKSAFAAIGEEERSKQALALELAGRNNDMEFISANVENFIESIEELVKDER